MVFSKIVFVLLLGSVCAFWGGDSDSFGRRSSRFNFRDDLSDNLYRNDNDEFFENRRSFGQRRSFDRDDRNDDLSERSRLFGQRRSFYRDDRNDDFYERRRSLTQRRSFDRDDSGEDNRFMFGRRSWGQQRSLGFQPRLRQQVPARRNNRISSTTRSRLQPQRTFQSQPQRQVTPSRQLRQPQRNWFGGNRFAQTAMMFNAMDGLDLF